MKVVVMFGAGMAATPNDAPRAATSGLPCCPAEYGDWYCTAADGHDGPHVAYGADGEVCARFWEDPS